MHISSMLHRISTILYSLEQLHYVLSGTEYNLFRFSLEEYIYLKAMAMDTTFTQPCGYNNKDYN